MIIGVLKITLDDEEERDGRQGSKCPPCHCSSEFPKRINVMDICSLAAQHLFFPEIAPHFFFWRNTCHPFCSSGLDPTNPTPSPPESEAGVCLRSGQLTYSNPTMIGSGIMGQGLAK